MGDMNSTIHSYCDGFKIVKNAENDYSLRVVQEGGAVSVKVVRRTGPTAEADVKNDLNIFQGILLSWGLDV